MPDHPHARPPRASSRSRCSPTSTATSLHCELATIAVPIGPAAGAGYRDGRAAPRGGAAEHGADAVHPGLRVPRRERRRSPRRRGRRARVHRAHARADPSLRGQGRGPRRGRRRRGAAAAGHRSRSSTSTPRSRRPTAVGFPLLVKSVAGGGGIGMLRVRPIPASSPRPSTGRCSRARQAFGNPAVFLERLVANARHVEVQVFGDGARHRRHARRARLLVAAPAPEGARGGARARPRRRDRAPRSPTPRAALLEPRALPLGRARSSSCSTSTPATFHFLEVNTRLQVEHTVTEAVTGVDLVEWMVRAAAGDTVVPRRRRAPAAAAVTRSRRASTPRIRRRDFRAESRARHRGDLAAPTCGSTPGCAPAPRSPRSTTRCSPRSSCTAPTRAEAVDALHDALSQHRRSTGIETNRDLLASFVAAAGVRRRHGRRPSTLERAPLPRRRPSTCSTPGTTTVQDLPGRLGSGTSACRRAGRWTTARSGSATASSATPDGAPGLECTAARPDAALRHATPRSASPAPRWRDPRRRRRCRAWTPVVVPRRAARSRSVRRSGPGCARTCSSAAASTSAPCLGSRVDVHARRLRRARRARAAHRRRAAPRRSRRDARRRARRAGRRRRCVPELTTEWELAVVDGPHAAPDFVTDGRHRRVLRHRLAGPPPLVAHRRAPGRADARLGARRRRRSRAAPVERPRHAVHGRRGRLHRRHADRARARRSEPRRVRRARSPSSRDDRWKLGQLAPGDRVRFVPVDRDEARRAAVAASAACTAGVPIARTPPAAQPRSTVLATRAAAATHRRSPTARRATRAVLVEYGPMTLDFDLRLRAHALARVGGRAPELAASVELTPGIRSLQVQFDPVEHTPDVGARAARASRGRAAAARRRRRRRAAPCTCRCRGTTRRPARRSSATCASVRDDAPWCPWNIEFIRRINGLDIDRRRARIVFDAEYLVLGLGDVYLGAPVAVPVDPRHRLVTTKYNPARTWTPGERGRHRRRVPVHLRHGGPRAATSSSAARCRCGAPVRARHAHDRASEPWLLRFFDRIRWYPVGADELLELRADAHAGRLDLRIDDGTFSRAEHRAFLARSTSRDIARVPRAARGARSPTSARAGRRRASSRAAARRARARPLPAGDHDARRAARRRVRGRGSAARLRGAAARARKATGSRPATRSPRSRP